jgi:hypothetical protein
VGAGSICRRSLLLVAATVISSQATVGCASYKAIFWA